MSVKVKTSPPIIAQTVESVLQELPPNLLEIAQRLREIIRRAAPDLQETIKRGHPCYGNVENVCSIVPHKSHLNLAFFRGNELDDPEDLLQGSGKGMRHVKLSSYRDIHPGAIANLIRAAAAK